MKKMVILVLVYFAVCSTAFSDKPEMLWTNERSALGEVFYSGLSITGDTLILLERNFVNLIDSKTFNLFEKVKINSFKYPKTKYFYDLNFFTDKNSGFPHILFVNLPFIFKDNNVFDIQSKTYHNITTSTVYNYGLTFNKQSTFMTTGKTENGALITSVEEYDAETGNLVPVFSLNSKQTQDEKILIACSFSENEYFYITNKNIKIYNKVSKEHQKIGLIDDYFADQNNLNLVKVNNDIYIFNNSGKNQLVKYDIFNKNVAKINNFNELFSGKDSLTFSNIYVSINNPELFFLNYNYNFSDSTGKYQKAKGLMIYNISTNSKIADKYFNTMHSIIAVIDNKILDFYANSYINPIYIYMPELILQNINDNSIYIKKTFDNSYYIKPQKNKDDLLIINAKKLEKKNLQNGETTDFLEFKNTISSINSPTNLNGYFIQFDDGKYLYSEDDKFIDYPYPKEAYIDNLLISPDQKHAFINTSNGDYLLNTKTNRFTNKIPFGEVSFFINDTLILGRVSEKYPSSVQNPVIFNINTDEYKIYDYNISKMYDFYLEQSNNKIYIAKGNLILKVIIESSISTGNLYALNNNDTLIKYAVSTDEKYLALHLKNSKTFLRIIDIEKDESIYEKIIPENFNLTDLLFIPESHQLVYTNSDFTAFNSNLIKYDINSGSVISNNSVPTYINSFDFKNYQNQNNNFIGYDETNNKIIFHYGKDEALLYNPTNLELTGKHSFKSHYKDSTFKTTFKLENIYQRFLWKQNLTQTILYNTYSLLNYPVSSVINSQEVNENIVNSRYFVSDFNALTNMNTEPKFLLFAKSYEIETNILQNSFKLLHNFAPKHVSDFYFLSDDDTKLCSPYKSDAQIMDTKDYSFYPGYFADTYLLSKSAFIFDNKYYLQPDSNRFYISEISTGKSSGVKKISTIGYHDKAITCTVNYPNKNVFITGHNDGFLRFWSKESDSAFFVFNIGSAIKNMFFVDNYKKLIVGTESGYYYCIDMKDYISVSVSNETLVENNIKIYPNPSQDYIIIEFKENLEYNATVTDIFGITKIEQNCNSINNKIDISNLSSGVYFIRIGNEIAKFVKL